MLFPHINVRIDESDVESKETKRVHILLIEKSSKEGF